MAEMNREIGERPALEWVDVTLIDVDHNYQRDVDGRQVQKILAGFRWDHFGAVVLAKKPDGRFAVTDGQHRCKAAQLHPDVTHVPALVTALDGMAAEAENFLVINRARKAVSTIDTYWAGVTAGDPGMVRIRDVLARAGCEVVADAAAYKPGHTNAVTAVGRAIERYGEKATAEACKVICAAWPTDAKALRGTLITSLACLIRNNKGIDLDRLAKVLAPRSFSEMTAHAEAFRKLSGGAADVALRKTLVEIYNKHLSTNLIFFGAAA